MSFGRCEGQGRSGQGHFSARGTGPAARGARLLPRSESSQLRSGMMVLSPGFAGKTEYAGADPQHPFAGVFSHGHQGLEADVWTAPFILHLGTECLAAVCRAQREGSALELEPCGGGPGESVRSDGQTPPSCLLSAVLPYHLFRPPLPTPQPRALLGHLPSRSNSQGRGECVCLSLTNRNAPFLGLR